MYKLLSEKVAKIRRALTIETDPARKFQYEQLLQEEEKELKKLGDRLDEIEVALNPVPAAQTNPQTKILILAAIPDNLRLDQEMREIRNAIERAARRDLFEIHTRTAVRPQDIRKAISDERPQIVHFCGHGTSDGSLILEDDRANHKPVSPESLAALFKLHAEYVNCVLLNACYSEKSAEAISKYIKYTIGMNQPIEDQAAIVFAQGFYDGLGYKNLDNQDNFTRAFNEAMVAIQMENLVQGEIPVLKQKEIITPFFPV